MGAFVPLWCANMGEQVKANRGRVLALCVACACGLGVGVARWAFVACARFMGRCVRSFVVVLPSRYALTP